MECFQSVAMPGHAGCHEAVIFLRNYFAISSRAIIARLSRSLAMSAAGDGYMVALLGRQDGDSTEVMSCMA